MTLESRMLSTQHVRFGKGPSEKDPNQRAPRRRPTSPHAGFGERPEETDRQQCRHRASGRLNQRIAHRALPWPVGSRDRVTR
jgi:hypothetical protein